MAGHDLPPGIGEMMLTNGAVVLFGPDYLENSVLMIRDLKNSLAGKAVLSCERIGDLKIPSGPVFNCAMIFFHRRPAAIDFGAWDSALLQGVELRSSPPKGLGVADTSPEKPSVELVPVNAEEMQLIVTWLRPLESDHIVASARAIERAYLDHGGRYDRPGIFKRLARLLRPRE